MLDPGQFIAACRALGVCRFVGVPDSLLKDFCAALEDSAVAGAHVIAANEGGAIALAAGHYLATGRPALVYMQNSGQGNAVNPLTSLADPEVHGIPMLLLVGWRGEPGLRDEPQHVKQGRITFALFETLGVPARLLPCAPEAAAVLLAEAARKSLAESRPVALIVRKGTFAPCARRSDCPDDAELSREQAIEAVLRALPDGAVTVSTTGMISREVYEVRERLGQDHSRDFLTVGAMGHASQIALGIALDKPRLPVVCLDGDGAVLMHMGSLAITGQMSGIRLLHIVFNNGAHDSVGGQPTVARSIRLAQIAAACGYVTLPVVRAETELRQALQNCPACFPPLLSPGMPPPCSSRRSTPFFMEVVVKRGARANLGRPAVAPARNKEIFMRRLRTP